MAIDEKVEKLISLVEEGKFLEAIQKFYAEDATMQENNDPPCVGLHALLNKEKQFLNFTREWHVHKANSFLVNGNRAAINWIFESTNVDGKKHRLNEVAYQLWHEGKIIQEHFYYDPVQRHIEI